MGVMGTGIAAGVAQTALQGQQEARKRDKKVRDDEQKAKRTLEVFEAHIKGLEENDGDQSSSARLHVEAQLRDQGEHILESPKNKGTKDHPVTIDSKINDVVELSSLGQRSDIQKREEIAKQLLSSDNTIPSHTTPSPAPNPIAIPKNQAATNRTQTTTPKPKSKDNKPSYKHLDIKA